MAIVFSANQIRKSFGVRPVFEGLTFSVESGEKIGLIGPNGAGKSTLLRIISGQEEADSGELSFQRGIRTGFLEQTPVLPKATTVGESVLQVLGNDSDSQEAFAGEILSRLELTAMAQKSVDTLSGGWRKRVALARELVKDPDLLLLDEPTNHLDIESILWLEAFLIKSRLATLIVTHDRLFLQRVTNRILELDRRNPGGILSVRGDYATYLEKKEELMGLQEREERVLRNTLRRETEWLRRGPKARTTKQQARISAAEALQNEVNELEFRNQKRSASLDFQSSEKKPKRLLEAKKITKSFGGQVLFRDLDVFIGPGDRIGLLGANGCGKSTLIRLLLGSESPDSGNVFRSEHLKVAYFEQNRDTLDPAQTLRKTLCPFGDEVNYRGRMTHIHGYLDRFLFRKEQFDMPIGRLSGGEQARVLIARLMQQEANVLVLDEPTNDLDVATLDVLQGCLVDFDGSVILVTHDRYFLDQVATQILAFPTDGSGKVVAFSGLAQWESWHDNKSQPAKIDQKASPVETTKKISAKRKLSFNEVRELQGMEARIQQAEARLSELQKQSESPENAASPKKLAEIFQAMAAAQVEIDALFVRWAELEALSNSF